MVMSALPLKADMCGAVVNVRFGPIADIASLSDHLVRSQKNFVWSDDAKSRPRTPRPWLFRGHWQTNYLLSTSQKWR